MSPTSSPSVAEIIGIVVGVFTMLSSLLTIAYLLGRYSVRIANTEMRLDKLEAFAEVRLDKMENKAKEDKKLLLDKIEELPCHNILPAKGC